MFSSPKIECFVQSVKFSGKADEAELKVKFYITPLKALLAQELSESVCDQLFYKQGPSEFLPYQETTNIQINLGDIEMQNLELYPHAKEGADGAGQLIQNVTIGKIHAEKLFPDSPDWSLIFEAIMPKNSHSLQLMDKYYQHKVWITMQPVQQQLFDEPKSDQKVTKEGEVESGKIIYCAICNEKSAWLANDSSAYCNKHVKGAAGLTVRKIRYSKEAGL